MYYSLPVYINLNVTSTSDHHKSQQSNEEKDGERNISLAYRMKIDMNCAAPAQRLFSFGNVIVASFLPLHFTCW